MGWISDIGDEIRRLDRSREALRKFGLIVGPFFLLLAGWLWFKSWGPAYVGIVGGAGFALIVAGVLFPQILSGIYRWWMALAFAMGWVMSRVMLIILFYVVVVPTGIVARLAHKHFLAVDFKSKKDTYWIPRSDAHHDNYEKMY